MMHRGKQESFCRSPLWKNGNKNKTDHVFNARYGSTCHEGNHEKMDWQAVRLGLIHSQLKIFFLDRIPE